MKRLEKEETVLPFFRCTNQWRNEVGVVSKQLKEGALCLPFLAYLLENKLKTYRIAGLGSTIIFATPDILITSGCGYSPMMMSPCGRVKFKMAAIVSRKYGPCCRERIVHIWTFVAGKDTCKKPG